ncbi:MAG: hypothetical protein P8012_03260 [Desulfobacterales bacterium]
MLKTIRSLAPATTTPPRKTTNCVDLGECARQHLKIPPGQNYVLCRAVHAEMNAIIHASRLDIVAADLYLFGIEVESGAPVLNPEPCLLCKRVIIPQCHAGVRFSTQGERRAVCRTSSEDF